MRRSSAVTPDNSQQPDSQQQQPLPGLGSVFDLLFTSRSSNGDAEDQIRAMAAEAADGDYESMDTLKLDSLYEIVAHWASF